MGIFRDIFGRWMFPPAFKDAEQAYAVRILNIVLGFGLGNSLLLFTGAIAHPELARRMFAFGAASFVFNLGLMVLTRAGRIRLAGGLAAIGYWLLIQTGILITGGLEVDTLMGLFSLSVFTGLFFGNQRGLVMTGVNVITVIAYAVAESCDLLRQPKLALLPTFLALETAYQMVWVASLLAVATESVRKALGTVHRDLDELRRSEEALRSSRQQLLDLASHIPGILFELLIKPDGSIQTSFLSGRTEELTGLDNRTEGFLERFLAQITTPDRERVRAALRQASLNAESLAFNCEYAKPSGETLWFGLRAVPRRREMDLVYSGVLLDITERKKAEAALIQIEENYRTVFNATSDALIVYDLETGRAIDVNLAMLRLYKLASREEALACSPGGVSANEPPHTLEETQRHIQRAIQNGLETYEWQAQKKTGELFWVEIATRSFETNGHRRLIASIRDVTERKQHESELRTSEARFRLLVESAPEAIFVHSDARFVYVNEAMIKLLGASSAEEIIGRLVLESVAPEFHEVVRERIRTMNESRRSAPLKEQVYLRMDGSRVPVETTGVAVKLEGRDAHMVFVRNITERKKAEAELERERDFSQTLVRCSPAYFFAAAIDGRILMMNESMLAALGYTSDEVIGKDFETTCVPERHRPAFARSHEQLATSLLESRGEGYLQTRDGRELLAEWHGRRVWKGQEQQYLLAVGIDITERRKAEAQIERQAALLAASHDAILVWEPSSGIQYMNPAAEELTGKPFAQAQGQTLTTVLRPQSEQELRDAIQEVTEKGQWHGELTLLISEARIPTVASRWTALNYGEDKPISFLITCNDITEQKRLETQYMRAQRLESVGTLASGVAHDLNNILTPVIMGAELLLSEAADEDARITLDMMKDSAQRGVETVKQLLTFARGASTQKGLVQPRHLLKEITRLLQQTLPKDIQVYPNYPEHLNPVLADPTQLHQVLMNLCVNARDAMPEGGVLSLTLENRTLDDAGARMHPKARAAPYVVFKVSDTGMGIAPEVLDHIFDPFFTTKPHGKGTGLGLATVLGIVENHGGFVTVESKPGQGTAFQVFLPANPSAEAIQQEAEVAAAPLGKGELVLVVDDEPAILHFAAQVLHRGGYNTLLATNASEALHLCEERLDHIRVVLTDLMMPFGDGRQLIAMLSKRHPTLPIIAMSGVATSEFQQETLNRGAWGFVQKPFATEDLIRQIADVLQKRTG